MTNRYIYTSLDALLDTSIGVVNKINPEAAVNCVSGTTYWNRQRDDWGRLSKGLITNEQFAEGWKNRDNDVVKNSRVTSAFIPLNAIILEHVALMLETAREEELVLEINIWPYKLDPEEIMELVKLQSVYYNGQAQITCVSIPMNALTPAYLAERYIAVFMREFTEWMKVHYSEVIKSNYNNLDFIIPRLFEANIDGLSTAELNDEIDKVRLQFASHMRLNFIESRYFSLYRPAPESVLK